MPNYLLLLSFLILGKTWGGDTLYINPNYPPLVYSNADIVFYKYTPKYIPRNLYEAFKILGANDPEIISNFKSRSQQSALDRGLYYPSARMRKEFCLEGYSNFVRSFHIVGIYYPRAMESYILLGFYQYLQQDKIDWAGNKRLALEGQHKWNRVWKKRKRKTFNRNGVKVKEVKAKKSKQNQAPYPDKLFWDDYEKSED